MPEKERQYYYIPLKEPCPMRGLYVVAASLDDAKHKARTIGDADPEGVKEATPEQFFHSYMFLRGAAGMMENVL